MLKKKHILVKNYVFKFFNNMKYNHCQLLSEKKTPERMVPIMFLKHTVF